MARVLARADQPEDGGGITFSGAAHGKKKPLQTIAQKEKQRAEQEGAKVVAGGGRPKDLGTGYYFEPTILTTATPDSYIAQEEVFGPVMTVLSYSGDDDAVAIANNSAYGLGGAIWGTDVDRAAYPVARRVAQEKHHASHSLQFRTGL